MKRFERLRSCAVAALGYAMVVMSPAPAAAQEHAHPVKPAVAAFEHYEGVRAALSADKLADAGPHAKALAEQALAVAGDAAKKAADQLAAAATLEDARKHFGELSAILVPIFQAEAIPGMKAYMCPMKKQPWAQKGEQMQNPYYGKAMATCGSPLPPRGK